MKRTRNKRRRTNKNKRRNLKRSIKQPRTELNHAFNDVDQYINAKDKVKELNSHFSKINEEGGVLLSKGIKLYGLQYCLKEKNRIESKIDQKLLEFSDLKEKYEFITDAFSEDPVKDVLRYTIIIESNNYLDILRKLNLFLLKKGLLLHPQHYDSGEEKKEKEKAGERKSKFLLEKDHEIRDMFNKIKKNEEDVITLDEIKEYMKIHNYDTENLIQLFNKIDVKNKKRITEDQFITFWNEITKSKSLQKSMNPSKFYSYNTSSQRVKNAARAIEYAYQIEEKKQKYIDYLFNRSKEGFQRMKTILTELSKGFKMMKGGGKLKGDKLKKVDRWHTSEPYKGINVVYLLSLNSGYNIPVEIQYHTNESIIMKQQLHDLYEETQNLNYKITQNNKKMLTQFETLMSDSPFDEFKEGSISNNNLKILYDMNQEKYNSIIK